MLLGMEPELVTAPELESTLAELLRLEPIFHWPPSEMTQPHLEAMTAADFWEVGASGAAFEA
jgi:hypothetical protein